MDIIEINNYKCIQKNRKQKVIRKSGGIAVLVKTSIAKYFDYIETECEYILWFKLHNSLFNADEDLYFGAVYVPPGGSAYVQNNILERFYQELGSLHSLINMSLHWVILMHGQRHSRT